MNRSLKRLLVPVAAATLAGSVLPLSAGSAQAADRPFGGFSADASAAPVKIELYEPTIPIPATPQLELEMAYTTVEADSGSSMARASWLWPGDPVGEGFKTFVEQLGLPPQLGAKGYPVQVNAGQPSGEKSQADEPFPGTVMRAQAATGTTLAQAGYSPDGKVHDGSEQSGGSGGAPGVPGLPSLPGAPGTSGTSGADVLAQLGRAITGGSGAAADDPSTAPSAPTAGAPGLPPQLAALVDFEGYTSSTKNVATGRRVTTTARSALGDVTLLGGLITLDGVTSTSTSSSNGVTGTAKDKVVLGGMTVAGQELAAGPEGFTAAGRKQGIPGLPQDPEAALRRLGIKLELPKPVRDQVGDKAASTVAGLVVDIDTTTLRRQLDALPIDALVNALPGDPPQLKSLAQTLTGLSPRVVVTLGAASTAVDTVKALAIPAVPGTATGGGTPSGAASGGAPAAGGAATSAGGPPPAAGAPGAAGSGAPATGDLPPHQLAGDGLPPLYTIPGAILAGGIALAAVGGSWLRRVGLIALGGAGSCTHGLDSGLPDLRKASR